MDIDAILGNGGYDVRNPNYNPKTKKGRAEQPYLKSSNIGDVHPFITEGYDVNAHEAFMFNVADYDKYINAGINLNTWETTEDWDRQLAESQSNWSKAANALAQTVVSEVGLGTIKGFSDLADAIIGGIFEPNNDYSNPVSQTLQEWQDAFNNNVAPIYTRPGVDIANGGLTDVGWWMSNMPSIMSSLTLMVPGMAGAKALSWAAKASKFGRGTRKAMAALGRLDKHLNWINDSENIARANAGLDLFANAAVMRTVENYQEARGTYTDMYTQANDTFAKMSDDDYNRYMARHPELRNDDDSIPDKDTAAKRIASRAADKTFVGDLCNVVFDVIQLYSLKNIGKNLGFVKSVDNAATRAAQAESIGTLGKTVNEAVEGAVNKSKTSAYWDYIKNHSGDWGKDFLAEGSEGIEEAINYIAQEEGLTYGRVLLEQEKPSSFDSRFKDYLKSPQLYESAFWGWFGGIAFEGGGSAIQKAKLARKASQAAKRRATNDATGEGTAIDATNEWLTYMETPEDQAAIGAIKMRNIRAKQLADDLEQIKKGINIFGKEDKVTHTKPKFEGDVEAQQRMAAAKLIQNYRASLALDAATSGTYDMLKEYVQADSFKKYMVDNGIVEQNEVDSFVAETLSDMDKAVNEFRQQVTHVKEQARELNKDGKTPVNLDYIQLIAKENTDHILNIEDLTRRLRAAEQIETEELNSLYGVADPNSEDGQAVRQEIAEAKELINIARRAQLFSMLDAQKRSIKDDKSISPMQKQIMIADITRRQKSIMQELRGKDKFANTGNLLYALRYADRTRLENGQYNFSESFASRTDKKLIEAYEKEFDSDVFTNNESTLDDFMEQVKDIKKRYHEHTGGKKGLINTSKRLFDLYHDMSELQQQVADERSRIATTTEDIANRVDFLHNQNNRVRYKMIESASNVIDTLYAKYKDNFNGIEEIINAAYNGDKDTAEKLANARLTSNEADELLKAIDIFNFTQSSNDYIYKYIAGTIAGHREADRRAKKASTKKTTSPKNPAPSSTTGTTGSTTGTTGGTTGSSTAGTNKKYSLKVDSAGGNVVFSEDKTNGIDSVTRGDGSVELQYDKADKSAIAKDVVTDAFTTFSFDITDENNNWAVTKNPVIKKDSSGKWRVIERGEVGLVDEGSDDANFLDTIDNTDLDTIDDTTLSNWINESVDIMSNNPSLRIRANEVYDKLIGERDRRASNSSTGGQDSNSPTPPVVVEASPQEIVDDEENQQEVQFAMAGLNSAVEILGDNFNPDTVKAKIMAKIPAGLNAATVEVAIDYFMEDAVELAREAKHADSEVESMAAKVVMAAKFVDMSSPAPIYDGVFEGSFDKFVEAYCKTLLTPELNGKKVVKVGDLMEFCEAVATPVFNTDAQSVFNVIRGYLLTHQDKYVILDKDDLANNTYTTSRDTQNVEPIVVSGSYRIDVMGILGNSFGNQASKDAINNLKAGDKVRIQPTNGKYVTIFNEKGIPVGQMAIPIRVKGSPNSIYFYNGWREEFTSNGDTVDSWLKDLFAEIFTSDNPDYKAIRELLMEVQAGNISEDEAVKRFENNPIIEQLMRDADIEYKNTPSGVQWTHKVVSGFRDRGTKMFNYLYGVWNYTQGINATNLEQRKNTILSNLEDWFIKRYENLNAALYLQEKGEVVETEVTWANDGQLLTATNNSMQDYTSLSNASEAFPDDAEVHVAIANPQNPSEIIMSRHANINMGHMSPGSTFIMVKGQNGFVPVKAVSTRISDTIVDSNPEIKAMLGAHIGYLRIALMRYSQGANDGVEMLNRWLTESFGAGGKSIGLMQGNNGLIRVKTQEIDAAGFTNTYIYFKDNDGNARYLTIKTRGQKRTGVGFKLTDTSGKIIAQSSKNISNTLTKDDRTNLENILADLFRNNSSFHISKNGLRYDDGLTSFNDNNSFFRFENGKFVVDIPAVDVSGIRSKGYRKEYDSYQDFLISNNLIKVNTRMENGSNFTPRGKNQRNNKNVHIRIEGTTSVRPESKPTEKKQTIRMAQYSSVTEFEHFKDVVENADGHKGLAIARSLFPASLFDNAEFRELIEALLPSDIIYDEDYNDATVDSSGRVTFVGNVADTASRGPARYNRTRRVLRTDSQGRPTYGTARLKANRVVIGDLMLSLLSGNQATKREAVSKLIHERLHNIISTTDNATREEIVKSIESIYDKFMEEFDKEYASDPTNKAYQYIKAWSDVYRNGAYDHAANMRLNRLEEFLVETMTNPTFMDFANNVVVDNAGETKKSLFDKIIEFIMKYVFGKDYQVSDNTLLRKELNTLANIINPSTTTKETATHPVEEIKESKSELTASDNVPTETSQPRRKQRVKRIIGGDKLITDDNRFDSSASFGIDLYSSLVSNNTTIDGDRVMNDGNNGAFITSPTQFANRLPVSERVNFTQMLDRGEINYRCS